MLKTNSVFAIFAVLFGFIHTLNAQKSITTSYLYGQMVPHTEYTEPLRATVNGFQLDADWDLMVERRANFLLKREKYTVRNIGVSLLYMNMGHASTGKQFAAGISLGASYPFTDKLGIRWRMVGGVSYLPQKYDSISNPINLAISSNLNYHANLNVELKYQFASKLGLNLGGSMVHASNGNWHKPNGGLNAFCVSGGLIYYPYGQTISKHHLYRERRKFFAYPYSLGVKLALRDHSLENRRKFAVWVFEASYRVQKSNRNFWDFGIDLFNDPLYFWDKKNNRTGLIIGQQYELGLRVSHVFLFGRIGLRTDFGYYVLRPVNSNKSFYYNAFGFDYRLNQRVVIKNRIKAHLNDADYMELGLSYLF
jgi:hypothetical protein